MDEMDYAAIRDIRFPTYRNSTNVLSVGDVSLTMEDILKAALISRLNTYLVSERGEGKTQIAYDCLSLFGNRGFLEQGRNDLEMRDIFTQLNLGAIYEKKALFEKITHAWNPETARIEKFVPMYDPTAGMLKVTADQKIVDAYMDICSVSQERMRSIASQAGSPLYVVDELTRCIPAVQNQFFNLFDGFVTIDGLAYPLGQSYFEVQYSSGESKVVMGGIPEDEIQRLTLQGHTVTGGHYSIGIATGNSGNGYVGVSEVDSALLDRMHLIIDLDNFDTQPIDDLHMLAKRNDPRVTPTQNNDYLEKFVQLHHHIRQRKSPLMHYVAAVYLMKGLDYAKDVLGNSKRKNKNAWPEIINIKEKKDDDAANHAMGSDEALIFPVSKRSAITYLKLTNAIEAVAEAKGASIQNHAEVFFDTFALVGAYSGILNGAEVDKNYHRNSYEAMSAIVTGIKAEFKDRQEMICASIGAAQRGKVDPTMTRDFTGRWSFMNSLLAETAKEARERK
jgi:hypothetical protein